jgi:hypothetical protein
LEGSVSARERHCQAPSPTRQRPANVIGRYQDPFSRPLVRQVAYRGQKRSRLAARKELSESVRQLLPLISCHKKAEGRDKYASKDEKTSASDGQRNEAGNNAEKHETQCQ